MGFRDLTTWSFLMASAHGAGFMVLPFVIRMSSDVKAVDAAAMPSHTGHMTAAASASTGSILLGLHTLSYLAVTGLAAWIVYRWLGLALLRTAWFNLDLLWAAVLAVTGAVVLLS